MVKLTFNSILMLRTFSFFRESKIKTKNAGYDDAMVDRL